MDGGDFDKVLKVLEGEAAIASAFGLRYNFSKMVVYPLAGRGFQGDLSGFERMGIKVDWTGNVKFMQVPIAGSPQFINEWAEQKMNHIRKVLDGLRGLSSKHVALYLLKGAGNACRVLYYVRAAPVEMLGSFVDAFDAELRCT